MLWNSEKGAWFDYSLLTKNSNLAFYPSNLAPLWAHCFNNSDMGLRAFQYLKVSALSCQATSLSTNMKGFIFCVFGCYMRNTNTHTHGVLPYSSVWVFVCVSFGQAHSNYQILSYKWGELILTNLHIPFTMCRTVELWIIPMVSPPPSKTAESNGTCLTLGLHFSRCSSRVSYFTLPRNLICACH